MPLALSHNSLPRARAAVLPALEQQPVPDVLLGQGHGAVPGVPVPSTAAPENPGLNRQARFHARALHISGLKGNIVIVPHS